MCVTRQFNFKLSCWLNTDPMKSWPRSGSEKNYGEFQLLVIRLQWDSSMCHMDSAPCLLFYIFITSGHKCWWCSQYVKGAGLLMHSERHLCDYLLVWMFPIFFIHMDFFVDVTCYMFTHLERRWPTCGTHFPENLNRIKTFKSLHSNWWW